MNMHNKHLGTRISRDIRHLVLQQIAGVVLASLKNTFKFLDGALSAPE